MAKTSVRQKFHILLIYCLLVVGAIVFCWPLAWMVFTSFKMDRELFARTLTLFPETPTPQRVSPYVDPRIFKDLKGKRQEELLPWLQEQLKPELATLGPDLDGEALGVQLARGCYKRLDDMLPLAAWDLPSDDLKKACLEALTPAVKLDLVTQLRRGLVLGQLRARSYDLQEDQLVQPGKVSEAWALEGEGKHSFVPEADGQGAALHYELEDGQAMRLVGHFKTSFPVERLYRLQLSLRADESWNDLSAAIEHNGKRFEAHRVNPMSDANWSVYTWQEAGPDDLTNKIRTWVVLDPAKAGGSYQDGANDLTLVLEFKRATALGAWSAKIKRNYLLVFDNIPFWRYAATSVLLVVLNLFGTLLSCSMVAYSFARLNWPGRNMSFALMMATMMVPAQVTMIPFFLIIRYLNWFNTLTPLWICSFFANAFNVFLMHQFFKGIPKDLEDAAKIDGCGPIRSYWYIMLPLVQPALATVAVFTFMGVWNDFMGPLIYLSDQRLYPLSLGLYALNVQSGNNSMSMMLAGALLMIVPVVAIFFFAQRYFIQGITMTGLKG